MSTRTKDDVFNPLDQLCITVLPADVQQQIKEEAPDKWRPAVDQQDPEALHIKEEQEEMWISLQEEQLNMKEETDDTKCSFTAVHLKSEDDEEKPLFSQLQQHQVKDGDLPTSSSADQMTSATGREDCGGAETSRNSDLNAQKDNCSSSETEVSEDDEDGNSSHSQLKLLSDTGPKTEGVGWKKSRALSVSSINTVDKSYFFFLIMKNNEDSHPEVPTRPESFSCDDCGKIFSRKDNLKTHKRVHTGQKPFSCDVCGQSFSHKTNLNRHTRIHIGQKPFACHLCDRTFRNKCQLNRHMRIHTGQNIFGCAVCGQTFCNNNDLNTHSRIHIKQKPFCCDVCEQRFSKKANLNRHMKIHAGQKPPGLEVCDNKKSNY